MYTEPLIIQFHHSKYEQTTKEIKHLREGCNMKEIIVGGLFYK
jgi:hypothetical protein